MVIGEKNGRLKVVAPSARCVELIGEQIQTGWDSSCPHDTISVSSIICLESQLLTLEDTKAAEEDDKAAEEAAAYERWLGSHPPLQPLQVGARRVSPRRTPGGDGQKK